MPTIQSHPLREASVQAPYSGPARGGKSTAGGRPSSQARRRSAGEQLRSLRQTYLAAAAHQREGHPRAALYVLVGPGQDPAARLAIAQAHAAQQGLSVVTRTFDTTGPTDPSTRPQLARLLSTVQRGEIHVIVAASRIDVSAYDDQYQHVLHQLHAQGGGLALARDESSS
ncbi:hypothetical protein [Streptomyces chryseus]